MILQSQWSCSQTHRRWTAGPGSTWNPATGGTVGTLVDVVTIDVRALLFSRDVVVLKLSGGRRRENEGAWFLRLFHHHGDVKPRQVVLLTHLGGKVASVPWGAAVEHVWAADSLKEDKKAGSRMFIKPTFPQVPTPLTSGYGQQLYPVVAWQQVSLPGHIRFPSGHLTQDTTPSRATPATRDRVTLNICRDSIKRWEKLPLLLFKSYNLSLTL